MKFRNIQKVLAIILTLISFSTYSWSWQDWWLTRDQQGAALMRKQQYAEAQKQFQDSEWKGVAAFRAQDFTTAQQAFSQHDTADAYYNLGNTLAHLKKYPEAIQAYEKSLQLRPKDKDTSHNKKIIEDLMKQEQQQQKNESSQKDDQQQKSEQPESSEQPQSSEQQNPSDTSSEEKSEQNHSTNDSNQDQKSNKSEDSKKEEESKNDNSTSPPDKKDSTTVPEQQSSETEAEEKKNEELQESPTQQDKQQWLNLIPDDPGGLLKQKFLRDHMRREQGENS